MSASPPVAEFVVRYDDAYFRAVATHLQPAKRASRPVLAIAIFVLACFVLACFVIRRVLDRDWSGLAVPASILILVVLVTWRVVRSARASLRGIADFGKDVRVRLLDSGVELDGSVSSSSYGWNAFERALLVPDGILLVLRGGSGLWVPTAVIVAGSREAAERVIARHVRDVERRDGARDAAWARGAVPDSDASARTRVAEYDVRVDHAYDRGARRAGLPRKHVHAVASSAFAVLVLALVALVSAIAILDGEWWKVVVAGVPCAALVVYFRLREPADLDHLRTIVAFRERMRILVTDDGVELVGRAPSAAALSWSVIARSKSNGKGIVLVHRDGTLIWLPDAARTSGTREDVQRAIANRVTSALDR